MAYESGSLDATLAAAAGEDIALLAELRCALVESAERQLDLLRRAIGRPHSPSSHNVWNSGRTNFARPTRARKASACGTAGS